MKVSFMY